MSQLTDKTKELLTDIVSKRSLGSTYLFYGQSESSLLEAALNLFLTWRATVDQQSIAPEQIQSEEINLTDFHLHLEESNSIKIDTVRTIQDLLKYGPLHQSKYFTIIPQADKLTKEAANAFLKTLEEPPENTTFILLTTNSHKLPKTILSRSNQLYIPPPLQPEIRPEHYLTFEKVLSMPIFDKLQYSQEIIDKKEKLDTLIFYWLEDITKANQESYYKYIPSLISCLENSQFNTNKKLQLDALLSSLE